MATLEPIKLAILGATGRMGTQVSSLALHEHSGFEIIASWSGGAGLGEMLESATVAVDFTPAEATAEIVSAYAGKSCALVSGTTGRNDAELNAVRDLGGVRPIFLASNMSPVVHLLTMLVEQAARALPEFDIEIAETHHSGKLDAPSGTAISLGHAASRERSSDLPRPLIRGAGAREPGEVGFSVTRGGNVVGEHEVGFYGEHERLTLSHRAEDRALFAAGALRAARWVVRQAPGVYGMHDLLTAAD